MELEEQEINLADILNVFKNRWKMMVFPGVVAAAIVWISIIVSPNSYESYALIKVGHIGGDAIESVSSLSDIMNSLPMRQKIADNVNVEDKESFAKGLRQSVEYSDETKLLRIKTTSETPEKAAAIVTVIADIIIKRHDRMCSVAKEDLDNVLKYVKKTISPIPLSCGITEFKIAKTEVIVPAFIDKEPMPKTVKQPVTTAFVSVLLLCVLLSFFLEGRKQ